MVYNRETAFVWSLIVVLFAVHVKTSNVNELSTNLSSQGRSSEEAVSTTQMYEMVSEEPLQQVPLNCTGRKDLCRHDSKCVNSKCQCIPGTLGEICETVVGCENSKEEYKTCGTSYDAYCDFNQTSKTPYCRCWNNTNFYDQVTRKCKANCAVVKDLCKHGGKCVNRKCQCLSGTHGEVCENVIGCENWYEKHMKCGDSTNVVCDFNETSKTPYCRCSNKTQLFDQLNKECKECNCGSHGNCSVVDEKKKCKCEDGYAEKLMGYREGMECYPCDCGNKEAVCLFASNGAKNCFCPQGYSQRQDVCAPCDCGHRYAYCGFNISDAKICRCPQGYSQKQDVCSVCDCGLNGECSFDDLGNKVCKCKNGFQNKNGLCEECDCGSYGECNWNDAGEKTCNCNQGYGVKYGKCTSCMCYLDDLKVNCTFLYGVLKCLCPEGYEEGFFSCKDINECKNASACPANTNCMNTKGSYECVCDSGYRPHNNNPKLFGCTDIDECMDLSACPANSKCKNTIGSYECICESGYHPYSKTRNPKLFGCTDQSGWKIGYTVLIVVITIVIFSILISIIKRRNISSIGCFGSRSRTRI